MSKQATKYWVMVNEDEGDVVHAWEQEERFEQMLDDCYEPVDICGMKYDPSRALKETDPTAYQCMLSDYWGTMEGYEEQHWTDDQIEEFKKSHA